MAYLVVRVRVKDYEKWRVHFDKLAAMRKANGRISERVLRNPADPKEVVLILEWDNLENAKRYTQSAELKKAIKESGTVEGEPEWIYLEETEEKVGV